MPRIIYILLFFLLSVYGGELKAQKIVVADSVSHTPLPNASVFDRNGNIIGICDAGGKLPPVPKRAYPIIVRYLGYNEKTIPSADTDTIFMQENVMELSELIVKSKRHSYMHLLAYVREYSTLSTYTDTVFLFREKMVDYMLPCNPDVKMKGWRTPRVLASKSYYHFTNSNGLDSVSDRCNQHFSWTDWLGIPPGTAIPPQLRDAATTTDSVKGRYGPTEIWTIRNDHISLDVDILADKSSRKWMPTLSVFFRDNIDFDQFKIHFNYENNIVGDSISPFELNGYSCTIESNGRGHEMFMFNRVYEPFFVNTYAEVYITDKEYITGKELKKWEKKQFSNTTDITIYEPAAAPDLPLSVQTLVDRINSIDHDETRLSFTPDQRLAGRKVVKQHFGQRVLQLLKDATGISHVRSKKKLNKQWQRFRKNQIKKNRPNGNDT